MKPLLYRHHKGGFYVLTGYAVHSETHTRGALYYAVGAPEAVYYRPVEMFEEAVMDASGGWVPRFALVGELAP